jgi:diguanylate cyclase (GGDEF)-like protein
MARRDPLEVLLDLTRTLAQERELQAALQATVGAAMGLLPCDHASLRLLDDARELMSIARTGAGANAAPARFRVGEGVLGVVAETGEAARIEDTASDPRFARRATGFDVRSIVAAPMIAGGRVVGVLSASSAEPRAFAERDLSLAQLLANCAVPAIESARLTQLAVTDDLTRALNQRALGPRLDEEVARAGSLGRPLSVLMLDIDHFKQVNDTLGHAAGDEVLRAFVERVRSEVRSADAVFRRGGEEFLLVMPSAGSSVATAVAERIRARVAGTLFETSRGAVAVTVSIGVATWSDSETAASLEARADEALYAAKREGRDRVRASVVR